MKKHKMIIRKSAFYKVSFKMRPIMKTTTKLMTVITTLVIGLSLTSDVNARERNKYRNAPVVITASSNGYEALRFRNNGVYSHNYRGRDYVNSRTPKIDKKIRRLKRKKVKKLRRMRRVAARNYYERPVIYAPVVHRQPVYGRPVITIPVPFLR